MFLQLPNSPVQPIAIPHFRFNYSERHIFQIAYLAGNSLQIINHPAITQAISQKLCSYSASRKFKPMGMKMMIIIPCILGLFFVEFGRCDVNSDIAKCSDQLSTVATCLPYVGGNGATAPKKDCCDGFKSALENRPECICLLIKDRNDPNLAFKINVTTAFTLPEKCKITTNRSISDCPAILNLPPNSPDAKVFTDFANSAPKSSVAAHSPVTHGGSTSAPAPIQTTVPQSGVNRRQPSRLETVSLVLLAMAAAPILASI